MQQGVGTLLAPGPDVNGAPATARGLSGNGVRTVTDPHFSTSAPRPLGGRLSKGSIPRPWATLSLRRTAVLGAERLLGTVWGSSRRTAFSRFVGLSAAGPGLQLLYHERSTTAGLAVSVMQAQGLAWPPGVQPAGDQLRQEDVGEHLRALPVTARAGPVSRSGSGRRRCEPRPRRPCTRVGVRR